VDFKLILTILFILVSVALTIVILCQEGKDAGFGSAFTGQVDSYWEKNKGRSKQGALIRATRFLGTAFLIIAILLQVSF